MALKDKLMTLEDFKAVRDVDVASNSAQFAEIKADLGIITGNTVIHNFTIGKYIATSEDTADINTPTSNATYAYVVVDCTVGDVFTITGKGGGVPRLFAFLGAETEGSRPVLSKSLSSATLKNQYITAPENAEKLVVNVNVNFAYCLITWKSIVNVWDSVGNNTADIAKICRVILYPNLSNPDDYTRGYKTNTGQTNTTSQTYMFTDKIPVNYGETVYFTTPCRYICAFDSNGTVVSASGVADYSIIYYSVPDGIASIQVTFYASDESGFMATKVEGQEYISYGTPVIDGQYIPHYDRNNSYIALKSKDNYYRVSSDSMAVADYLLIEKKLPVKNETVLQFSGNITGEFGGIEFGFTDDISQSDSTHFKIDATKLYRVTSSPNETDHNLTISGNLSITVTQTYTHLMIDIVCNGQKFHNSSGWAPQNKFSYVKVLSPMTDCVLSWVACKSKKNIVIFGDSYVSYSESRWVYYLEENGFGDNVVISGYSGEGSENGYQNFLDLMPVLSAQYVVWAYGMNDHDTSSAANATWKQKLDAVIAYCEQNGLTPVLCTIPNVPRYSNAYKNAYVRSFIGTYPVIDFSKAVGSDISSAWYDGMLSSDNVHPAVSGAMALYNRAIADFPQLCVDN